MSRNQWFDMIRYAFGIVASGAMLAYAVAPDSQPWSVEALLKSFKQIPGLEARFREVKTFAILAVPLVSEGTLHFAPPARLARHTIVPDESSLLIDGRTLSFGDGSTQERIDLEANPVVREYVNSFLQILEGDSETLGRIWSLQLEGGVEEWEMTLRPTSESLRKTIREMVLRGRGITIEWMKIVESTGDESVTTFTDINPKRRYSSIEIERIFKIPPDRE